MSWLWELLFFLLSMSRRTKHQMKLQSTVLSVQLRAAAAAQFPVQPSLLHAPVQMAPWDATGESGGVLRRAAPSRVITPDRCCSRRCARASRPLSHPSTRTCSLCESGSRSSACLRCESCCEQSVFRRTVQAEEQTQKHSLAAALTEWLDYLWAWELFLGLIICILGRTKLVVPPGLHSLC